MKLHIGEIDFAQLQGHAITIGTFDGVHLAHRAIVDAVIHESKLHDCESVLITFDPHPREVVDPKNQSVRLLTSLDEKLDLLRQISIDHLVVIPFTFEFSRLSAREYLDEFIISKFHPRVLVVGFDHRFGLNRQGGFDLLNSYAQNGLYSLIEISKRESEAIKISSTAIRNALTSGQIKRANELLGYRYFLTGKVVKGDNLGTSLGYPTANLKISDSRKLIPKFGIYAAFVVVSDTAYQGLLYIGSKPSTHEGDEIYIEVNLRNFHGYLYEKEIRIDIVKFIRCDQKFDSLDELKIKITEDEKKIVAILDNELNSTS